MLIACISWKWVHKILLSKQFVFEVRPQFNYTFLFSLCYRLIPEMWKHEEEKNPIKEDEEKRVLPRVLWEIIEYRSESMLIWLESNGAELGESWIPKEDSEMLELMSYFYGWRLVIDLVKTASPAVSLFFNVYV